MLARVPTRNEQDETDFEIREGVIHISGQEIIPCAYQTIERGFNSSPPKVLPGGKLLAITEKANPMSTTPRASCWQRPRSGAR